MKKEAHMLLFAILYMIFFSILQSYYPLTAAAIQIMCALLVILVFRPSAEDKKEKKVFSCLCFLGFASLFLVSPTLLKHLNYSGYSYAPYERQMILEQQTIAQISNTTLSATSLPKGVTQVAKIRYASPSLFFSDSTESFVFFMEGDKRLERGAFTFTVLGMAKNGCDTIRCRLSQWIIDTRLVKVSIKQGNDTWQGYTEAQYVKTISSLDTE